MPESPITVEFNGGKELAAALEEMKKAAAKAVLRRAGIKALQPFDRKWRTKAPKAEGNLSKSGGVGTKLTRRQAQMARRSGDTANGITIYAGPNDPAAIPNEFGTVKMAAQPFIREAWAEEKDEIPAAVGKEIWSEVEKKAARDARKALRLKG